MQARMSNPATVVGRVCLDMLRARTSRRELPLADEGPEPAGADLAPYAGADPEREAILADAVGAALLVVLETLTPAERLAFVLHDLFAVPFDDIAPILGRSPAATRQLASRARRRVRGTDSDADPDAVGLTAQISPSQTEATGHRAIVDAFLAAAREGRFDALLALLAPDVVLRADPAAVASAAGRAAYGAPSLSAELRGAATVAETFSGRAQAARPALIDGVPGAVWAPGGHPRAAFRLTIVDGAITAIAVIADPATLAGLDMVILDAP